MLIKHYPMSHSTDSTYTIFTGFKSLDDIIGGFSSGHIYAICGRPVMGKTSLCLSMCSQMAFDEKVPTAFFSLEMPLQYVIKRLSLIREGLKERNLLLFEYHPDKTMIHGNFELRKDSLDSSLIIDDDPTSETIFMRITRLVHLYGVRVIFIDYLELLALHEDDRGATLKNLRKLAEKLNVIIIIGSALHHYSLSQDDRNPAFCHRQGIIHTELMKYCDIVAVIHRPSFYDGLVSPVEKAEIHVLRQKQQYLGFVTLSFTRETCKFDEVGFSC